MTKFFKLSLTLLLMATFSTVNAQIKRYTPKSDPDSFLKWLDIGVGYFEGKLSDKQFLNSGNGDYKGISISARVKDKAHGFAYVNYEYGLPGYDEGFMKFFANSPPLPPVPNQGAKYNALTRHQFSRFFAGVGYNVFGKHRTRFAFSPVSPNIGVLNYDIKVNYIFNTPDLLDASITGSNLMLGNTTSFQARIRKWNLTFAAHVATTLKNTTRHPIEFNDELYLPEFFVYTLEVGIKYRL